MDDAFDFGDFPSEGESTIQQISRLNLVLPKWIENYRWTDAELLLLARQDQVALGAQYSIILKGFQ